MWKLPLFNDSKTGVVMLSLQSLSQESYKASFILKITVVRKMLEILVTYPGKKVVISFYICSTSIASRVTLLHLRASSTGQRTLGSSNSPLIQGWPDPVSTSELLLPKGRKVFFFLHISLCCLIGIWFTLSIISTRVDQRWLGQQTRCGLMFHWPLKSSPKMSPNRGIY